jgi:hypothetical protein
MKIVAFLQNLWVKNPARVEKLFADFPDRRESILAQLLFSGGKTGKVLRKKFGVDLCNEIIWEESTTVIAATSDGIFPPDHSHIKSVLMKHRPEIVLGFGKIASKAVLRVLHEIYFGEGDARFKVQFMAGPHPAAIGKKHSEALDHMVKSLILELNEPRITS